jgi:hypothetical protein
MHTYAHACTYMYTFIYAFTRMSCAIWSMGDWSHVHVRTHMCMYKYVCIFLCMYACIYACIYLYVYIHTCTYVCICMYMYLCMYMYTCYIYICKYIHIYICMYMYINVCTYMYKYVHVCIHHVQMGQHGGGTHDRVVRQRATLGVSPACRHAWYALYIHTHAYTYVHMRVFGHNAYTCAYA